MIFSLVRVVVGLRAAREDDVWFFFCATIELTIGKYRQIYPTPREFNKLTLSLAILIACLVSYRSLFTQEAKSNSNKYTTYAATNRFRKERTDRDNPYTQVTNGTASARRDRSGSESSTIQERVEVVPLHMIRVQKEFEIHSPQSAKVDRGQNNV